MPQLKISSELLLADLVGFFFVTNLVDAFFTSISYSIGVPELNPIWAWVMARSLSWFMISKFFFGSALCILMFWIRSIKLAIFADLLFFSLLAYEVFSLAAFARGH